MTGQPRPATVRISRRSDPQRNGPARWRIGALGAWLSLLLLLVFLAPRLPSVGELGYLQANWWKRSGDFIDAVRQGRLRDTSQSAHPGVTTMWILGTSLFLADRAAGPLRPPQQLWVMDLAQVLWTAILTLFLFVALRRTLVAYGEWPAPAVCTAALACAVVALDPMYLTFTQVVSLDAPLAALAAVAVLVGLTAMRINAMSDFILAGAVFALAVLTKTSALVFLAGMGAALLLRWLRRFRASGAVADRPAASAGCGSADASSTRSAWPSGSQAATGQQPRPHGPGTAEAGFRRLVLRPAVALAAGFAVTFVVCWPAMWVTPLSTLRDLLVTPEQAARIRDEGLGALLDGRWNKRSRHALLDVILHPEAPGDRTVVYRRTRRAALYYPEVIWFKATPLTMFGTAIGIFLLLGYRHALPPALRLMLHLGLFALLYFLCMGLAAKKIWRYMLPFLVFADLFASLALVHLVRVASVRRLTIAPIAILAAVLTLHWLQILFHHPHFITYHNPLSGGRAVAEQYVAFDWSEGIGDAARFMEAHARSRPVRFFTQHYRERMVLLLHDGLAVARPDEAEFIIVTSGELAQVPMFSAVREVWETHEPEHVVRIFGVPYAWVFRVPGGPHTREVAPPRTADGN